MPEDNGSQPQGSTSQEPAVAPSGVMALGFGVGEMPPEALRFNWGAFLLMPFWGVVYGLPVVIGWWAATYFLPVLVSLLFGDLTAASTLAFVSAVLLVVTSAVKMWVGMNANAWLWRREHFRLEVLAGVAPRYTVSTFFQRQRKWIIGGAALVVLTLVSYALLATSTEPDFVEIRAQFGITPVQVVVSAGWTVAETLLALWLAMKLRNGSDTPGVGVADGPDRD